jgi:hypothetical protein
MVRAAAPTPCKRSRRPSSSGVPRRAQSMDSHNAVRPSRPPESGTRCEATPAMEARGRTQLAQCQWIEPTWFAEHMITYVISCL